MSDEKVLQITSPYFVAGLTLVDGVVKEAAPILNYMKGWSKEAVYDYVVTRKWTMKFIYK